MGAFKANKSRESIMPGSVLSIADRDFHNRMNFPNGVIRLVLSSVALVFRRMGHIFGKEICTKAAPLAELLLAFRMAAATLPEIQTL